MKHLGIVVNSSNLIFPDELKPEGFPRVFMYRLSDPVTKEICYIGQAVDPRQRMISHCNYRKPSDSMIRFQWVVSLHGMGLTPVMTVFDWVLFPFNNMREKELIKEYWSVGHALLQRRGVGPKPELRARLTKTKFARLHGLVIE